MEYEHTQIGYLIFFVLLFVMIIFGVVLSQVGFNLAVLVFMLFIIFILVSFSTLNVVINKNYLRVKFGYGIFRKRFLLRDIALVKVVKNHWYYGWGIRLFLWPKIWIYNVSGFDAVEITMKNSIKYRIGTDEPKKLEQAVLKSIKK